jgi:hypothetical protein
MKGVFVNAPSTKSSRVIPAIQSLYQDVLIFTLGWDMYAAFVALALLFQNQPFPTKLDYYAWSVEQDKAAEVKAQADQIRDQTARQVPALAAIDPMDSALHRLRDALKNGLFDSAAYRDFEIARRKFLKANGLK